MIQSSSSWARGFTLIEMAFVIIISGLLMAGASRIYLSYVNERYANESYERLRVISSSLAYFIGTEGRLPCPSNPTIPFYDPNAGREIATSSCQTLRDPATPVGTCLDGVCKVNGARDTEADVDSSVDPVLVGGLPFAALSLSTANVGQGTSQRDALDPWNFQFTYAVSGYLTNKSTYRSSWGAIDVRTEPSTAFPRPGPGTGTYNPNDPLQMTLGGISVVDPPGSSQYVVVAHGPNHIGAYSADGVIAFACNGTQDADNCDTNPVVQTTASFTAGIRRDTKGAAEFDDQLIYNSYAMSSLWDFVGTTGDIHNLNPGFVGVGIDSPTQQLEVAGNLKATQLTASKLCDMANGAECWSPDLLAAPASSGKSLYCPTTSHAPNLADVVTGITTDPVTGQPKAVCGLAPKITPIVSQSCPAGSYVNGFNSDGTVICFTP